MNTNFIAWHYSAGLKLYLSRWQGSLRWVIHYFSLPRLLFSLFAPYRRLVITEHIVGFKPQIWFQQVSYNLISRVIGAVVRLTLFLLGLFLLLPITLIGFIGLLFWLCLPPIGLVYYLFHDPADQRHLNKLVAELNHSPSTAIATLFASPPGKFFLAHLGVTAQQLTPSVHDPFTIPAQPFVTFSQIIHKFIDANVWPRQTLLSAELESSDLLLAAHWWDQRRHIEEATPSRGFGQPGIGVELLYGYTPTLDKYGTNLTVTPSFADHLIGRADLVSRLERSLSANRSVVITGLPGVGKKTIVLEFAYKCFTGQLGNSLSYKRVIELDYNVLLSQSLDIAQKKTLLSQILSEAIQAGNIILVIKDLHRLTHSDVEGLDFTDLFEKHLDSGRLLLIAIESQAEYERFLATNSRLRKHMDTLEATPPSLGQATDILLQFSADLETRDKLTITTPAIRAAISGSDKYVTDTPFPEKALELMDHAVVLVKKQSRSLVTASDVNQVLSERTGVSLARLTENEKTKLGQLEELLHRRIVGQSRATSLIAKTLRARAAGTKSENRPLGSFLFLGPTGVGKTETAKALAEVYYGSDTHMLRFDMAEYAGPEGLTRLIGSAARNQPGTLTTAIKNHPANLLLLDEIEKAPPEVFNLFLSLLDEGMLTDALNQRINCRNLFVIATSNAGAVYIRELVNQNAPDLTKTVLDYVQKQGLFSPEFLNRFDGVVVFEPLSPDQLKDIAAHLLAQTTQSLQTKGITLTINPAATAKLAEIGFEPEFGARPMRRLVEIEIGDVIGKALLSGDIQSGDQIELLPADPGPFTYRKLT